MIRRPPRSTQSRSSAASDVYKRQWVGCGGAGRTPPTRGSGELRLHVRGVDVGERRLQLGEAIGDLRLLGEDVGARDADLAVAAGQEHPGVVLRPRMRELLDGDLGLWSLGVHRTHVARLPYCLLYTSDAADDLLCVDLGG